VIKKIASSFGLGLLGLAFAVLLNFTLERIGARHPGANVFPHCEECDPNAASVWLIAVIPLFAFAGFAILGYIALKRKETARQALLKFGTLAALIVLADQTIYTAFLIDHSDALYANREIQSDDAYAPPVLSKSAIQVYDRDGSKLKANYVMQQWERCAIGDADAKAALVSIHCKRGEGWIKQADADKLINLPNQ
jgi:hypothetical protein